MLQQLEAGEAGHLDVEKQDVHPLPVQKRQRFVGIGRAADDLDASGLAEQPRQPLDRQPFIVDDVRSHHWSLVAGRWPQVAVSLVNCEW